MVRWMKRWMPIVLLLTGFLAGCGGNDAGEKPSATISAAFESGSIGEVAQAADAAWEISLADDNDDHTLPDSWRCWWYVKMERLAQDAPTQITVKNQGWPYYYLPIYSYDRTTWFHFAEEEVAQNAANELILRKRFDHAAVWIARFYPYTFTDLEDYLKGLQGNPYVGIQVPGYSQEGNPIYLLKITDPAVPASGKKRIFIHARTHPAETPPSFVIEGMVDFLLSGTAEASAILSGFEFYLFPMQNVDGVVAGNYRSTPKTENLESMWFYDPVNPLVLTADAPKEVAILQQVAKGLMADGGPPVSMALNLHASNSEPDIRPFFYPHFGTELQGYAEAEASLWRKQLSFIDAFAARYGLDMIEPVPEEGGSSFATKTYPESWWWVNFQDRVMAMTLEMTYGRAGYSPRWVEPDDLRDLGTALALSIRDYYDESAAPTSLSLKAARGARTTPLKYPELYPPHAVDELKE